MIDLFGTKISDPVIPHNQLPLFDKMDYRRMGHSESPAIVLRENGEKANGVIDIANRYKVVKKPQFTFTSQETGNMFRIPLRCCTMTWAGDIAVISIAEDELHRRTSLWGIFASCRLKLLGF